MSRPCLSCCEPHQEPWPSGWRWTHSRSCRTPSLRGQKVTEADTRSVTREEALSRLAHPAGTTGRSATLTFHAHPHGCLCDEGCSYVDAHLDDADDLTLEAIR